MFRACLVIWDYDVQVEGWWEPWQYVLQKVNLEMEVGSWRKKEWPAMLPVYNPTDVETVRSSIILVFFKRYSFR